MKVYIVIHGCDEESRIIGVFLRMSKAEHYVKNLGVLGYDYFIEEYKVTI